MDTPTSEKPRPYKKDDPTWNGNRETSVMATPLKPVKSLDHDSRQITG